MAGSDSTYDLSLLERSSEKWRTSSGLRLVYHDFYRRMSEATVAPVLEIGSGIGSLREIIPDVELSDVAKTPFVSRVVSAYDLGGTGSEWGTICATDVFHHLRDPFRFLQSAAGVLRPGGRVVLLEPAATPWGRLFYRAFHTEPTAPKKIISPYIFPPDSSSGEFANMGMGWAIFMRDRRAAEQRLNAFGLHIASVNFFAGLSYPLTGGLSHGQMVPDSVLRFLLATENALPQWIWRFFGLRMLIVLNRSS